MGRREGPEAAESGQRSWPTLASAVCPLGRHVVREEGGQKGGVVRELLPARAPFSLACL